MFIFELIENIERGRFEIQSLIILILIWPLLKLVKYAASIFTCKKAISNTGKFSYKAGAAFLILSALIYGYTFAMLVYLFVTKSSGIPIGIGFGFALMAFIVGSAFVERSQEPHVHS